MLFRSQPAGIAERRTPAPLGETGGDGDEHAGAAPADLGDQRLDGREDVRAAAEGNQHPGRRRGRLEIVRFFQENTFGDGWPRNHQLIC